jgi:hypothetical protein
VNEAIAEGSPAVVKSLLQALIHEIRVDSRNAIQPVFRVPLAGNAMAGDTVRAPSRSVDAEGLEPSTPSFGDHCFIAGLPPKQAVALSRLHSLTRVRDLNFSVNSQHDVGNPKYSR